MSHGRSMDANLLKLKLVVQLYENVTDIWMIDGHGRRPAVRPSHRAPVLRLMKQVVFSM